MVTPIRLLDARLANTAGWHRLAVIGWTILLCIVCIRGLLAPQRSVYPIFATAARDWIAGANLYGKVDAPYRYSPLVTAFFVPFSLFSDRIGGLLWRLLNAAAYLTALAWWSRAALPLSLSKAQQAILFLLVIPLSLGSLSNGQSNPLILGLMLAGIACVTGERWNTAAAALAGACLFKIYPIALGLLLSAIHPRRFAGRFSLALAVGLALPFMLQHPRYVTTQYAGWFAELAQEDRQAEPPEFWYRDLRLLCHSCGIPLNQRAYVAIGLTVAAGIAVLCITARQRGVEQKELLGLLFALACCWMTLLGPASESCTYMLLAPALAVCLLRDSLKPEPRWVQYLLVGSYGLFTAAALAVWFPCARQFHTWGPHPLAALLFLVAFLTFAFRLLRSGQVRLLASEPLRGPRAA